MESADGADGDDDDDDDDDDGINLFRINKRWRSQRNRHEPAPKQNRKIKWKKERKRGRKKERGATSGNHGDVAGIDPSGPTITPPAGRHPLQRGG